MKRLSIFIYFMAASTLSAQPPRPVINPGVVNNPNLPPPNPDLPPAPNPLNTYNPYGSIDGAPGSAFSEANAAAIHFINIVDNQAFSGAWLDLGGIVQDVVPQKVWAEGMRAIRVHLGPAKSRKVISHRAVQSLPGGMTGNFLIIKYQTQFANKPNATEVVTLMMHPPLGLWKVINYQISH